MRIRQPKDGPLFIDEALAGAVVVPLLERATESPLGLRVRRSQRVDRDVFWDDFADVVQRMEASSRKISPSLNDSLCLSGTILSALRSTLRRCTYPVCDPWSSPRKCIQSSAARARIFSRFRASREFLLVRISAKGLALDRTHGGAPRCRTFRCKKSYHMELQRQERAALDSRGGRSSGSDCRFWECSEQAGEARFWV